MIGEQWERAEFILMFQRLVSMDWVQQQYATLPALPADHFWMHVTDVPYETARAFLKWIFAEKLIEDAPHIHYTLQGNWLDFFPPHAYRVTEKGKALLAEPHAYVMGESE